MSLSGGLAFVQDQILVSTPGVPLEFKQPFVDAIDGRITFIQGLKDEYCEAAADADTVTDIGRFAQLTDLRAEMQRQAAQFGLRDSEVQQMMITITNSILIAFCPSDFERIYGTPAR